MFYSFPSPTVRAIFVARPQRFLAEVTLEEGEKTIAYCPNPGSFQGCLKPGSRCLLWDSDDEARKRRYTLRAIMSARAWLGTDTHLTNDLVEKSLRRGLIRGLEKYSILKREPRVRGGIRLDFLIGDGAIECLVEVKSATIAINGVAQFPDSISPRSIAQLKALTGAVKAGQRAIVLFVVQRGDVHGLRINLVRDPSFNRAFSRALSAGVEFMAIKHGVTIKGFGIPRSIPVIT